MFLFGSENVPYVYEIEQYSRHFALIIIVIKSVARGTFPCRVESFNSTYTRAEVKCT